MTSRTYIIEMTETQLLRISRAVAALDALDPPSHDDDELSLLHDCCESTLALTEAQYDPKMLHGFAL